MIKTEPPFIHPDLVRTARDFDFHVDATGKFGHQLTESEIAELSKISTHPIYAQIKKAQKTIPFSDSIGRRKSLVQELLTLQKLVAHLKTTRAQAVIYQYMTTIFNITEIACSYGDSYVFGNLIRLYPTWTDKMLAEYCISNNIHMNDDQRRNKDPQDITKTFTSIRNWMNSQARGPISESERIYAERWLEITERQTQKLR